MATFPQVLLCILAVVAIFIFILATLICCLLRFIGRPDYITASDAAYYDKIDTSNEKSYLLDTAHGMFLECQWRNTTKILSLFDNIYSRVHISSDTAFLKILKKPSIVQE